MNCENCDREIKDGEPVYEINDLTICEDCMEEYDPEDIKNVG